MPEFKASLAPLGGDRLAVEKGGGAMQRFSSLRYGKKRAVPKSIEALGLRINGGDVVDAHIAVVGELGEHARDGVFRGQDLENGDGRVGQDLLDRTAAVEDNHVRDALAGKADLHAQLGADANVP